MRFDLLREALPRRVGMCSQALSLCDLGGDGAESGGGSVVELDDAGDFDEIQHVQRGGKTGGAAGGHDVAGPSDVIAQHFKATLADEEAAGVGDFVGVGFWVGGGDAGVLGGVVAGELARFVEVGGEDDAALRLVSDCAMMSARLKVFHLFADFDLHGFGEGAGGGEENGRCQHIMFRLGQ